MPVETEKTFLELFLSLNAKKWKIDYLIDWHGSSETRKQVFLPTRDCTETNIC